jgi:N-acetylglutamate synthase-like GNAT family acetyltransferase
MAPLQIRRFEPADEQAVIDVILPIQREEFGIAITAEDQPDLRAIPSFYQQGLGDFLVADLDGRVVGTIGLKDIGASRGALRKMFVAASFRGRDRGVAQALLTRLLDDARRRGVREILLGTTERFLAAHRFYERNGFQPIDAAALPPEFPRMAVDTRFYRLTLT